ncbi:MAG TPA: hypothetical protein PKE00_13725 [Planctomycetota bacterium]|nr:hypothetical protein [Planctomycetota bacterium]
MQPEDLFLRTARGRNQELPDGGITGDDILRMFKWRLKAAGIPTTFVQCVQNFLGHADPRTTKLYDAREKTVTRNLVKRIGT